MISSPYVNPIFLLKIAKNHISDSERPWNQDKKQLKKYQDITFRKIVQQAYNVPLYHEKYKQAGIHPSDIREINDITKLPFITKDDLRENFPHNILPSNYNKRDGFLVSTSGSTGKPVFLYVDIIAATRNLDILARSLKEYNGSWNKSKIMMILDFSPGSIEHATFIKSAVPFLKKIRSLKNIKYVDISEKPEEIIEKLDQFNPTFFGSDPNMLRELAIIKNEGDFSNIKPEYIISSGSMLDEYTQKYVEDAFDTQIIDTYATTEAGAIAFKCRHSEYYHINSDFIYLEFLDANNNPVSDGEPGHTVFTKLYGNATPIIRYTGIDDIAIPVDKDISCSFTSQLIKTIDGRMADLIILPNGTLVSPLNLTGIPAKIIEYFHTYKIKQFQIIQHKKDEIEVKIQIDEKLRDKGPSVKIIFNELEKRFREKIGNDVKIHIHEVGEIQKNTRCDYVKVVISNVKK